MPKTEAQTRATKKYDDKAYDKYLVLVPKGQKAIIQEHAKKANESLSGYTAKAVEQRMEREAEKP